MAKNTDIQLRQQMIYSIFVRNHTPEGTFAAVEKDLDRIQALGTDIIWFMPIQPVGVKGRKGKDGSPYAIRDYRKTDPAMGSMEDFRHLTDAIHKRGMKCILDVVYNHTSPDSWLIGNHPEYFKRDADGNMVTLVPDWTDIADLDYTNKELWRYQIDTLKMWAGMVDGFRCDVALRIPVEFWQQAREEVETVRPGAIWLAESAEKHFIKFIRSQRGYAASDSQLYEAFDICYDYDIWFSFLRYIKNADSPLSLYLEEIENQEGTYPENYVKLRYLENHDQDRIAWLSPDKMSVLNWTAFSFLLKGTAFIYAGQEAMLSHRPSIFDKDTLDFSQGEDISDFIARCAHIKKTELKADGIYSLFADDEHDVAVTLCEMEKESVLGIFSLKGYRGSIPAYLQDGIYKNLLNGGMVSVENGMLIHDGTPVVVKVGADQVVKPVH